MPCVRGECVHWLRVGKTLSAYRDHTNPWVDDQPPLLTRPG